MTDVAAPPPMPNPQTDMVGWVLWNLQYGADDPFSPMPSPTGYDMTGGTFGMPEDEDEWGTLDHQRDAMNAMQDYTDIMFDPSMLALRALQYGPGAVNPGAFEPTVSYDPLPTSEMGNLTPNGQGGYSYGNPLYAQYLDPTADMSNDLVGRIVRAVLAGQPMAPLVTQALEAYNDPNAHGQELHDLARASMLPMVDYRSGKQLDAPNVQAFSEAVTEAVQGATQAQALSGAQFGVDPATNLPAVMREEESEAAKMLREAGFSNPLEPYSPDMFANEGQLEAEQAAMDAWLNGGVSDYERLLERQENPPLVSGSTGTNYGAMQDFARENPAYPAEEGQADIFGGFKQLGGALGLDQGLTGGLAESGKQLTDMVLGTSLGSDGPTIHLDAADKRALALGEITWDELRRKKLGYTPGAGEKPGALPGTGRSVQPSQRVEDTSRAYVDQLADYEAMSRDWIAALYDQERRNRVSRDLGSLGYTPFAAQWAAARGTGGNMGFGTQNAMPNAMADAGGIGSMQGWQPPEDERLNPFQVRFHY